jgi:hypothetical protein
MTTTPMLRKRFRALKVLVSLTPISASSRIIQTNGSAVARRWTATTTALMTALKVLEKVLGLAQESAEQRVYWLVLDCWQFQD